jgi:hypothetical protein
VISLSEQRCETLESESLLVQWLTNRQQTHLSYTQKVQHLVTTCADFEALQHAVEQLKEETHFLQVQLDQMSQMKAATSQAMDRIVQCSSDAIEWRVLEEERRKQETALAEIRAEMDQKTAQMGADSEELTELQISLKNAAEQTRLLHRGKETLLVTPDVMREEHQNAVERMERNIESKRQFASEAKLEQMARLGKSLEQHRDFAVRHIRQLRVEAKAKRRR